MNDILLNAAGTPKIWADVTDYVDFGFGARTHQIDLTSLADDAGREGAKADMAIDSYNSLPQRWAVFVSIETGTAPTDGEVVEVYWAPSTSLTAATGNPASLTGADAAVAAPTSGELGQLQYIGAVPASNEATTRMQKAFITSLPSQFGMPVVVNRLGQALDSDAINMAIAFVPLKDIAL